MEAVEIARIQIDGTLEHREDHWASTILAMGIVAYGDTQDEAIEKSLEMAKHLLAHWSEHNVLAERARSAGLVVENLDNEQPYCLVL